MVKVEVVDAMRKPRVEGERADGPLADSESVWTLMTMGFI